MRSYAAKISRLLGRIPPRLQFAAFLGGAVIVTIALTVLSYSLYLLSGTAQLDLSRPGYKQALSEVSPTNNDNYDYSASGALNKQSLDEFKTKYDALIGKTKGYSAFDPGAMSDDQLNLNASGAIGPQ